MSATSTKAAAKRNAASTSTTPEAPNDGRTIYSTPALEKGLDVLELLARQREGLTKSEIARRLDRTISEIHRLDRPARVTELARMLGGQSDAARKHAEALLPR